MKKCLVICFVSIFFAVELFAFSRRNHPKSSYNRNWNYRIMISCRKKLSLLSPVEEQPLPEPDSTPLHSFISDDESSDSDSSSGDYIVVDYETMVEFLGIDDASE